MRHSVLWTLALLGLPGVALADGTTGPAAEQILPGGEPAIERTETSTPTSPPALDLRLDPTQLPSAQVPPNGPRAIRADRAERPGAEEHAADRGLSFGVEVKPRSRVDSLAREDETDAPGLEDDLQRLIDKGTLGVRGRYRF